MDREQKITSKKDAYKNLENDVRKKLENVFIHWNLERNLEIYYSKLGC